MLAWHCLWLSCRTDRAGLAASRAPADWAAGGRRRTASSQRYGPQSVHRLRFRHEQHHGGVGAVTAWRERNASCTAVVRCGRRVGGFRQPCACAVKSPTPSRRHHAGSRSRRCRGAAGPDPLCPSGPICPSPAVAARRTRGGGGGRRRGQGAGAAPAVRRHAPPRDLTPPGGARGSGRRPLHECGDDAARLLPQFGGAATPRSG